MGKFSRNKFKVLKKISKTLKNVGTNKILKKKVNAEKRVTFQKEVLLKEAVASPNSLVSNISPKPLLLERLSKIPKQNKTATKTEVTKPKLKPVEKHKKRQKTQIDDTKLLLNLLKNK